MMRVFSVTFVLPAVTIFEGVLIRISSQCMPQKAAPNDMINFVRHVFPIRELPTSASPRKAGQRSESPFSARLNQFNALGLSTERLDQDFR